MYFGKPLSKSGISKAIVPLLVGCVCLGFLVVLYLQLPDRGSAEETEEAICQEVGKSPRQSRTTPETETRLAQVEESESPSNSMLFLGNECPDPLEQSSLSNAECAKAIDQHFRNEAAYTIEYFGMVPKESPFTYGEMFNGFKGDRELVVDALLRPECRLLEGPIRMDLRESCNADALGRFALLTELCHTATGGNKWFDPWLRGSKSAYRHKMDELGDFESNPEKSQSDVEAYYAKVNEIREGVLKDVWLGSKCPSFTSRDHLFPDEVSRSLVELARWWDEGTNEVRKNQLAKYDLPPSVMDSLLWAPYERLAEIAVRLGDTRLVFYDSLISLLSESNEYRKSKRSLYLWMEQLNVALEVRDSSRERSIALAARGFVGMRESGFEADVVAVARFLCETEDSQEPRTVVEDCASMFRAAELMLDTAEWKALRMLDEIATVALDQGFFQ